MFDASAARDLLAEHKRHIVEELELGRATVHELAMEDVVISEDAWRTVGRIAMMIMRNHVGHPSAVPGCAGPMLRDLTEEVYWVEETRHLVFRIEYGDDVHLIQVPPSHWMVKTGPGGH